jgi:type II secretory pathway pseudopilin PulG
MKNKNNSVSPSKGFTLIEILIGMAIAISVIGLIVVLQVHLSKDQLFLLKKHLANQGANDSIMQLKKELRNVQTGENGDFPLFNAQNYEIGFFSDINDDGRSDKLRYFLDQNSLKKGIIHPDENNNYPVENENIKVITDNIKNIEEPIFTYYNADWPTDQKNNPLPSPALLDEVKLIEVYLRVNTEDTPETDYVSKISVQPRILKDNL